MPRTLLLATKNKHKVTELRDLLDTMNVRVVSAADYPDIDEPIEDGETFVENARKKALYYATKANMMALADDSGLAVDALDGRPGVQSSRYAPTDQARIERVLRELDEIPEDQRTARFICSMVLAENGRVIAETEGRIEGSIAREPAGDGGFGYDPVFYVTQLGCTLAQVPRDQKNEISHRGNALRQMLEVLRRELA